MDRSKKTENYTNQYAVNNALSNHLIVKVYFLYPRQRYSCNCPVALTLLPVLLYSARLYYLASGSLPLSQVLRFYVVYFPARAHRYGTFQESRSVSMHIGYLSFGL